MTTKPDDNDKKRKYEAPKPISTVKQRKALKPDNAPYWHAIGTGRHVGYRKQGNSGAWSARFYDSSERKRYFRSFGDLANVPDNERFTEAVRLAGEFFNQASQGGRKQPPTVAHAWDEYAAYLRKKKGEAVAVEVEQRKARHIDGDPIADVRVDKITKRQLEQWRERITGNKSASTVNRDMVPMPAALRLMLDNDEYAISEPALRKALKALKPTPQEGTEGSRTLTLLKDQRRALLDAITDPSLRAFVTVLALLPLRPGALAAALVEDFDKQARTLYIRKDKAHAGRTVPIPDNVAALFRAAATDKLPKATLMTRADGKAWDRYYWRNKIKDAVHAAGLPEETVLYTLRHTGISALVTNGLDIFTVATIAGTSVAMIEKHYGHLNKEHARKALAGLSL